MVMVFSWLGKKNKNDFTESILSPSEKLACEVRCHDGKVYYQVLQTSGHVSKTSCEVVTTWSHVGLKLYQDKNFTENLKLIKKVSRKLDDVTEARFYFVNQINKKLVTLRFRVFDGGVAFRWEIPAQPKMQRAVIAEETNEFNIKCGDFVVKEAALYNYGAMNAKNEVVKLSDGNIARVNLPFETPWRVITKKNNDIVEKLNREPRRDFGWVKPIKAMGLWWAMVTGKWSWSKQGNYGTTLEHATEYMQFCKKNNIKGLMIDGFDTEIARQACLDKINLICSIELTCDKSKMETMLRALAVNNVHYVRFGYVPAKYMMDDEKEPWASQAGVKYLQDIIELAAKYHIMLEMPSIWKDTGTSKTWPNVLARKGKRTQDEKSLTPSEVCRLAYDGNADEYMLGVVDLNNKNKCIHSTLVAQLAYYVVFPSKMQFAIDQPEAYEKYPKAWGFIKDVPIEWGKMMQIAEKRGEYYAVARKHSTSWYVGGINNEEARNIRVNFDFLSAGKYRAKIYIDGDSADYQRNKLDMEVFDRIINKDTAMDIWMASGGGFAMEITKVS